MCCRMTAEEKEKAQEQLKALNQAYSDLSQHCADQAPSAEQVGYWAVCSVGWIVFVFYVVVKREQVPPSVQLHD